MITKKISEDLYCRGKMYSSKMIVKGKRVRILNWVMSILGGFFILAGIYFLFASAINFLAPTSAKEPYSSLILPSIGAIFLVIGIPMLWLGSRRKSEY
jgi:peptidoglycan/LPS O-acetylase OafA/YrhL